MEVEAEKLNDFFEAMFEPELVKQSKTIIIPAVHPSPGVAGGSIMWRCKCRFQKKREKWLLKMREMSAMSFLLRGGLLGAVKRREVDWPNLWRNERWQKQK